MKEVDNLLRGGINYFVKGTSPSDDAASGSLVGAGAIVAGALVIGAPITLPAIAIAGAIGAICGLCRGSDIRGAKKLDSDTGS